MTAHHNHWGVPYTASQASSIDRFEAALTSYLNSLPDTMEHVDALLADDPDMVMAHCFRGYMLKLAAHPQFSEAIHGCGSEAQRLLEAGLANEREQFHVQVLQFWIENQTTQALATLERCLAQYPLDVLAIRIAHLLHFYEGDGRAMCASTDRLLPQWSADHPHYHYLVGMHAFGLEESGSYDLALEHGQTAVAHNAKDIWSIHAVSHVHLMREAHHDGLAWLERHLPGVQQTNNFLYHVDWHEALHWLGLDEPSMALKIYDERLADSIADDFYLDLCNNTALLWRLEFLGVDVGDRWQALADCASNHVQDQELLFASLHYLIPLVVTQTPEKDALFRCLQAWGEQASDSGRLVKQVGLGMAEGILHTTHAPEMGAGLLVEHDSQAFRIGGSRAQRELFRLLAQHNARRVQRDDLVVALATA